MSEVLKAKAVKGAGINVVTQSVGLVFNTVSVIILARLLPPKDFGLVAMVTAFSVWLMNFGGNGFTEYIVQKSDITKEEINSIFWLHVLIASTLAILFTIFGIFLVDFYSEPALSGISAAMSISFIFMGLCTTQLALLQREMKFKSIALIGLTAIILSIICAISAAVAGMSYWAIVIRQLTIPGVTMVGAWILCSWRPGLPSISKAFH